MECGHISINILRYYTAVNIVDKCCCYAVSVGVGLDGAVQVIYKVFAVSACVCAADWQVLVVVFPGGGIAVAVGLG